MSNNMMYSAHPFVDQHPLMSTRVMSPTASTSTWTPSSGPWMIIRTCHACADVMTGPTVTCSACHAPVHSHCVVRRMSCMVCTSCANEMDFAFANHQAQLRMAMSSAGFGRFMSASGQYARQAIGAVATGAVGGAARLMTGCASGAVSAIRGMRAVELPSAPAPQRPRFLEQFDISDAGSGSGVPTEVADVMAEFRRMRAEMEALREENARLRGGSAASAQGGYATPSSPERPAEEITEAQDEGIDAVYGADWSQAGGPAVSGAGDSAAETHEVNAAREAADTVGKHVEEFSDSAQLLMPASRLQDIQEVVILMAVVFLEALVYLEEVSGVLREVSHLVLAGSEGMDLAMEVGILMGFVAVASDYQVDLVAEVGPAVLEEDFQEVVGPIVLVDLAGSLEAERDLSLESTLAKLRAADLPRLAWKGGPAAKPGVLEHWIQRVSLDLGGMHHLIERYWSQVLGVVVETCETYLRHGPLDRPAIRPMQPAQFPLGETDAVNFHSVELRLRGLLLALVPEGVKQACLSTRQTSTTDILFSACVSAGPGTGADRGHALEQVSKGRHVDVKSTYDELQRWKFSANRLATLGVAAPDPSKQLSSLKAIAHKMLESNEEVKHRYFGFLVTRGLSGGVANQAQVDELWRYLSAEAREFADAAPQKDDPAAKLAIERRLKGGPNGHPKGGKGDPKGGKGDTKGKDDKGGKSKTDQNSSKTGAKKLCTFFESAGGCTKGASCSFAHRKLSPSDGKCFNCGSTEHRSADCTRPRAATKVAAPTPSPASTGATSASTAAGGPSVAQVAAQTARAEVRAELMSLMQMGSGTPSGQAGHADADFWNAGDPKTKMVNIKAKAMIVNGERYLLADTGATHELKGVEDFDDLGDDVRTVQLETATGSHDARMVGDTVFVLGEHLQGLFPLASYVESMGLEMEWNPRRCGVHVGNEFVDLHRENGSIYISEKNAEILRAARRAQLREKFRASMAALATSLRTLTKLRERQEGGRIHFDVNCPQCRGAHGRMCQHFRHDASARPGGQLSIDLSGPHLPGRWPSGRSEDTGRMAQHFVLGAFSVVTAADMQSRADREAEAREAAGVPDDVPEVSSTGVAVDGDVRQLAARVAAAFEVSELGELRLRSDYPGLMAVRPVQAPDRPQDEEEDAEAEVAPGGAGASSEPAKTWYFVVPLENKRFETCKKGLEQILAMIRSEFEGANVVYRIHGDRASELTGTKSKEHFAKQGILVTSTPGYEPNNNPRAEKGIGLVKLRARAMLLSFTDPRDRQDLWPMAVQHAAWCSRMAAQGRQTNCPAFGAKVSSRVKDLPHDMLSERAVDSIFLGVDPESAWLVGRIDPKASRPEARWVIESSSSFVIHPEAAVLPKEPESAADERGAIRGASIAGSAHFFGTTGVQVLLGAEVVTSTRAQRAEDGMSHILVAIGADSGQDQGEDVQEELIGREEDDDDDIPLIFQEIQRESGMTLTTMKTLSAAFGSEREEWRQALEAELISMTENEVFRKLSGPELREARPRDVLPMKVVAGEKAADSTGYRKKKARGVVCGNFEVESDEPVYCSNLDIASLRASLAVACKNGWSLGVMDVSTAFLNAHLPMGHKRVVVRPPAVFVGYGLVPEGELWVAEKAIYGLRVSPKAWSDKRDADMKSLVVDIGGEPRVLRQSAADPAVWAVVPQQGGDVVGYVLAYVDDFLMMGSDSAVIALRGQLGKLWRTSSQPIVSRSAPGTLWYLSIDIELRADGALTLGQRQYAEELLEKWGMLHCNGTGSINFEKESFEHFMATSSRGDGDDDEAPEVKLSDVRLAQKMAGGLLWLASRTRPDIACAVSRVASIATARPLTSLCFGKKVLRYLSSTRRMGLYYLPGGGGGGGDDQGDGGEQGPEAAFVQTFADASHEDVGTQTGFATYLDGCLIDWRSVRQQVVAFSTCEAEVNALAMGESMQSSVVATLESMQIKCGAVLYGDNSAANQIATGRGTWRTRALSTKVNAIRSRVERGLLTLQFVATSFMKADGLTKCGGVPHAQRTRAAAERFVSRGACLRLARHCGHGVRPRVPDCVSGGGRWWCSSSSCRTLAWSSKSLCCGCVAQATPWVRVCSRSPSHAPRSGAEAGAAAEGDGWFAQPRRRQARCKARASTRAASGNSGRSCAEVAEGSAERPGGSGSPASEVQGIIASTERLEGLRDDPPLGVSASFGAEVEARLASGQGELEKARAAGKGEKRLGRAREAIEAKRLAREHLVEQLAALDGELEGGGEAFRRLEADARAAAEEGRGRQAAELAACLASSRSSGLQAAQRGGNFECAWAEIEKMAAVGAQLLGASSTPREAWAGSCPIDELDIGGGGPPGLGQGDGALADSFDPRGVGQAGHPTGLRGGGQEEGRCGGIRPRVVTARALAGGWDAQKGLSAQEAGGSRRATAADAIIGGRVCDLDPAAKAPTAAFAEALASGLVVLGCSDSGWRRSLEVLEDYARLWGAWPHVVTFQETGLLAPSKLGLTTYLDLLRAVAQLTVAAGRAPWLLQADFNMEPATLQELSWPECHRGVIVGPWAPTCFAEKQERAFDWFVASQDLARAASACRPVPGLGLHPRAPVELALQGARPDALVHVLRRRHRVLRAAVARELRCASDLARQRIERLVYELETAASGGHGFDIGGGWEELIHDACVCGVAEAAAVPRGRLAAARRYDARRSQAEWGEWAEVAVQRGGRLARRFAGATAPPAVLDPDPGRLLDGMASVLQLRQEWQRLRLQDGCDVKLRPRLLDLVQGFENAPCKVWAAATMVVFISGPSGGVGPIALLPLMLRLWGWALNAVASHAQGQGVAAASFFVDISKFSENIRDDVLWRAAVKHNLKLPRGLLVSCQSPRCVAMAGLCAAALTTGGATLASCLCAKSLAKLPMLCPLVAMAMGRPLVCPRNVFDRVFSRPLARAAQRLSDAGAQLVSMSMAQHLPVNASNAHFLTSNPAVARGLRGRQQHHGWTCSQELQARSLGTDACMARGGVAESSARARQGHEPTLSSREGAVVGIPDGDLRCMRIAARRSAGRLPNGAPLGLRLHAAAALRGSDLDPEVLAVGKAASMAAVALLSGAVSQSAFVADVNRAAIRQQGLACHAKGGRHRHPLFWGVIAELIGPGRHVLRVDCASTVSRLRRGRQCAAGMGRPGAHLWSRFFAVFGPDDYGARKVPAHLTWAQAQGGRVSELEWRGSRSADMPCSARRPMPSRRRCWCTAGSSRWSLRGWRWVAQVSILMQRGSPRDALGLPDGQQRNRPVVTFEGDPSGLPAEAAAAGTAPERGRSIASATSGLGLGAGPLIVLGNCFRYATADGADDGAAERLVSCSRCGARADIDGGRGPKLRAEWGPGAGAGATSSASGSVGSALVRAVCWQMLTACEAVLAEPLADDQRALLRRPEGFAVLPMPQACFAAAAYAGEHLLELAAHDFPQLPCAAEAPPPDDACEAGGSGRRRNRRGKRSRRGRADLAAPGRCADEALWSSHDFPPLAARHGQDAGSPGECEPGPAGAPPAAWGPGAEPAGSACEFCEDQGRRKLLEAELDAADQERQRSLLLWLLSEARGLALSRGGCLVLQRALEVAQAPERRRLASELYPHAVQLYESPHGNHVVTMLIKLLPPPALQPLIERLQEKGAPAIARHQYGCRVLERLVEHCPAAQIAPLLDEVAADSEGLSLHPYGNFVIQHILEHGSPCLRRLLAERLLPVAPRLATHRTASHVVQRVLDFCDGGSALVRSLLFSPSPHSLEEVACNRYGCHVVRQLSELRDAVSRAMVQERLAAHLPFLEASQFGRRALEAFELVAPLPAEAPAVDGDGADLES
ncbi:unnamed protein product [Prorocentrum cordatum]|uniref:Retrovirus-related Pol polyprotein from transposon TNT 1-94 n=1 Tax=Prorocentrum cordatum TaxID=2364126 RepID=A0ABN9SXA3_9DINO|nr:unnamed protein product [Polarella glacialis]